MKRRILSMVLALAMILSLLPSTVQASGEEGFHLYLKDPTETPQTTTRGDFKYYAPNSYVYFGEKEGYPIKWRVLDADKANDGTTEGIFLLSENVLDYDVSIQKEYHDDGGTKYKGASHVDGVTELKANRWEGSDGQAWTQSFAADSTVFSELEQSAMLGVSKTDLAGNLFAVKFAESSLSTADKMFFLSMQELYAFIGTGDFVTGMIAEAAPHLMPNVRTWWLRSPHAVDTGRGTVVDFDGEIFSNVVDKRFYARPAFNLNPDSILFALAAEGGKASNVDGTLQAVADPNTVTDWQLTLKDANRNITIDSFKQREKVVTFRYSGAVVGENEYLSAVIKDKDDNITYYGRLLKPETTEGTATIDLTNLTLNETDKILIFSEQYNGDKKVDYAGTPVELKTYTVKVTNTDGLGSGSSHLDWAVAGTEITLTATPNEGYQLKEWKVVSGNVDIVNDSFTMQEEAVSIQAVFAPSYEVIVGNNGNGAASASADRAIAGTEITLTATPNEGYHFKEWQVVRGGISVTNNSFIMQEEAVELRAIFEEDIYTITLDANDGAAPSGMVTGPGRRLASLPVPTRFGYIFNGWFTAETGGTLITETTVFTADTTIYAQWTKQVFQDSDWVPIHASAGEGGKISPNGRTAVFLREDKTFTITPDPGYVVESVLVDGKDVGAVESYTFRKVEDEHRISATFVAAKAEETNAKSKNTTSTKTLFDDVKKGDYFYRATYWAEGQGITKGTSRTKFSPRINSTRGQMVTFLWRIMGRPEPMSKQSPFTDLEAGEYYHKAVLWAVEQGFIEGTDATRFLPDKVVTRAEAISFLYRVAGSPKAEGVLFKDVAADAPYADAVRWAVENGITSGIGEESFRPNAVCSRAQMITFLHRWYAK